MGEIGLARGAFLWGMVAIYLCAFASLYVQIPGLYGKEGILPVRRMLPFTGKPLVEQLTDSPTLLWLCPWLGLDTEQGMEFICLLGISLSVIALVAKPFRDCFIFACLWILYLSVYQVGQVFLYFQWDSLLLESGFLAILVAPLHLKKWRAAPVRHHDGVMFWLVRWLFFRLMFASGVVKLTSRCPTWWGLTALTYHYETQCIPTSLAWFAHQLPSWFHKLSVVIVFVLEIVVPVLFFAPIRHLRIFAFYTQILLQVLIIVTGNYNFFNLLSIVLALSLLDDQHIYYWIRRGKKQNPQRLGWLRTLQSFVIGLTELAVYVTLIYGTIHYFGLSLHWEKRIIESKTGFTFHEFTRWLKTVTPLTIWIGVMSLTWEILSSLLSSLMVRGFIAKLWATSQSAVFAVAAAAMFAVSLVPFTFIEYETNSNLRPEVRQLYDVVDRYQLVNSYGLFRRMTGVGGRPEVVVEGSYDGQKWKEIEFMYKPGNLSVAPPVVAPHQPRLDWQMWFAALGDHRHSPWFTSFIHRLLQGKRNVIRLVQVDETKYAFSTKPPTYIRAQLYKYWYTVYGTPGSFNNWWTREHVGEFFPSVSLGDPNLESLLREHGFKDKVQPKRAVKDILPTILKLTREQVEPYSGEQVIWGLYLAVFFISLLKALTNRKDEGSPLKPGSRRREGKNVSGDEEVDADGRWKELRRSEGKMRQPAEEQPLENVRRRK
ncbi:lipase maturation factor 2a isoform X1 [Hemiscyllium ocellatum]|uniref:lipase maturation factor 2a isoform X1 n=2 Tax=Hemiscyllium ocellatum TaxID=170820 RepID=UPI00296683C4|nr:lipase maturation factor 2a isoform X1 [Hemiscyllium ocellatum]